MDFHMKLPRDKKGFALFILIVSFISVNTIAPIITFAEVGFGMETWFNVLRIFPVLWPTVIVIVLLVNKPASALRNRVMRPGDSFHPTVTIDILCNVLLLSVALSVIGFWIGTGRISMEPITGFFGRWPRNFTIALFIEMLIAQPIARAVLQKYHERADQRAASTELPAEACIFA
jgi:hypothetical protein